MSLTPEEVIRRAAQYGVKINTRTLANYPRNGLIPAPKVRSLGRGLGRFSEYPPIAVAETVAAAKIMEDRTGEIITRYEAFFGPFVLGGPRVGNMRFPSGGRVKATELASARSRAYSMTVKELLATVPGIYVDQQQLEPEEQAARLRWIRTLVTWLTLRQCVIDERSIPDEALVPVDRSGNGMVILEIHEAPAPARLVDAVSLVTV